MAWVRSRGWGWRKRGAESWRLCSLGTETPSQALGPPGESGVNGGSLLTSALPLTRASRAVPAAAGPPRLLRFVTVLFFSSNGPSVGKCRFCFFLRVIFEFFSFALIHFLVCPGQTFEIQHCYDFAYLGYSLARGTPDC